MASRRDEAFQACVDSLSDDECKVDRALLRKAWEAGRRYEVGRVDFLARRDWSSNTDEVEAQLIGRPGERPS